MPKSYVIEGETIADVKARQKNGAAVIGRLLYRQMPCKPNTKKWTKYGQALDWHLLAVGFNCLPDQLNKAYGKLSYRVTMTAANVHSDQSLNYVDACDEVACMPS